MKKTFKWLKAFLAVSRWEYLPCSINEVGLPALIALEYTKWDHHFQIMVIWSTIIWWFGHFIGSQVNCITDYASDIKYKDFMANGVDYIGRKILWVIIAIETVLATIVIGYVSIVYHRPYSILFWATGLFFGTIYSVEPFRWKAKAFLNSVALEISLWICPMFLTYYLIAGSYHSFSVLILLFFSLLMGVPMFLVDEVSDFEEDKENNDKTPCVIYGRYKVSLIALVVYFLTSVAIIWSFHFYHPADKFWIQMLYAVAGICFLWVLYDFLNLAILSYKLENKKYSILQEMELKIKKAVRTPVWLVLSGIPVILMTIAVLF